LPDALAYRTASPDDVLSLSVLATQVFLDTYATNGINADLAKEARTVYAPEVLAARLADPAVQVVVAGMGENLIAFVDIAFGTRCPQATIEGPEVFRLYVQAPFQRRGIGRDLMARAEAAARDAGGPSIWLTAWSGNSRALAFYASLGYKDVGVTQYVIEGKAYENRVLAKTLRPAAPSKEAPVTDAKQQGK
jgi:ribosomal protein S18 acetylase RimI-like enzyme